MICLILFQITPRSELPCSTLVYIYAHSIQIISFISDKKASVFCGCQADYTSKGNAAWIVAWAP